MWWRGICLTSRNRPLSSFGKQRSKTPPKPEVHSLPADLEVIGIRKELKVLQLVIVGRI
jgi:hypothetical protein